MLYRESVYIGKSQKTINTASSIISICPEYFLIFGPSVRAQRLSRAASILTFQSGSIRAIRRPRFQVRIPETFIFGASGQPNTKNTVLFCKSARDRAFRVHETSAGVTVYRACAQKLAGARRASLGITPLTPYLYRQDPYSSKLFGELQKLRGLSDAW